MKTRLRILAVDDNSINLATIEQELRGSYEVITVNSGIRAIQYLRTAKPDLILLDIQMALKDGIETLKEIRALENGATIPVIMLTAKQDKESIIECSKLGALDYVLKPFNAKNLQERIVRSLKRAGVLEVSETEIYEKVKDIETEMQSGDLKNAVSQIDEVLCYKMDEEISGRLQIVRTRLKNEEIQTALRMTERVVKMLEKTMVGLPGQKRVLPDSEVYKGLRKVLVDLEGFKVHEASDKLEQLQGNEMSPELKGFCEKIQSYLDEYDDGAAEEALRKKLEER